MAWNHRQEMRGLRRDALMEGDLTDSYEKVHKDSRKFRKRLTLSIIVLYGGMIAFATDSILLPAIFSGRFSRVPYVAIGVVGLVLMVVSILLISGTERQPLEKRLFMKTYRALSPLTKFLEDASNVDQRELCRDRLRELVPRIDKLWSIESALEKESLGPIVTFKHNLQDKILYSVEEGSVENMRTSSGILSRLARLLLDESPKLSEVDQMNKLASDLPERPASKGSAFIRFGKWLGVTERVMVLIAVLSGPTFYTAAILGGVPFDVAFGAATVVAMGLLAPSLTYYLAQGKASKKKPEPEDTSTATS